MDVELAEVRDFLARHPPFDTLPQNVLDSLPAQLTARYYRRGTVMVAAGQLNQYMYILRSGAVDIIDARGALADREDPGGAFGMSSVLSGQASLFTLRAHEDSLCLLMHADLFHELLRTQPAFARFFMAQQAARMRAAADAGRVQESGSAVLRTRVRALLKREPVTVAPTSSLREAAQLMTDQRVSALLVTDADRLVGILTDRDLRSKVVARGASGDAAVATAMTRDPVTIGPDSLAFEVLVDLTHRGFHHLPVVEAGRIRGMVTSGDLMRLEQSNPAHLVGDIASRATIPDLVEVTRRVPAVVEFATARGASADDVARILTAFADALTRRIIELAEADLGHPPVPYCWVALGSQGRLETGLQSDQDNALLLDDSARDDDIAWFRTFAGRVVDGLAACGFERCPGDMMASNPRWTQPVAVWTSTFRHWINEPEPDALLNAQTFFDMRPVFGEARLFHRLHTSVLGAAPGSTRFLSHLAKGAQQFQPPLGFFRDFVLVGEGEHKDTLDLKAGGIATIVQMARLFALSKGIGEVNTVTRLRAAASAQVISAENADNLVDAFEFLTHVRLEHQVRQLKAGGVPDNNVRPSDLGALERRHLRDAFQIVRKMQAALAFVHRTDLTT